MFCNFCGNHRSEGDVSGCPNKTNDKVLVQTWNRGYQAAVKGAQILDTNETFQLGYNQGMRMKNGESPLD